MLPVSSRTKILGRSVSGSRADLQCLPQLFCELDGHLEQLFDTGAFRSLGAEQIPVGDLDEFGRNYDPFA